MRLALLAASACLGTTLAHTCIHDQLLSKSRRLVAAGPQGGSSAEAGPGRRLQSVANIRIVPIYEGSWADPLYMNATLRSFLITQLIPAAIARWSAALRVTPVSGPLYFYREGYPVWNMSGVTPVWPVWPAMALLNATCEVSDGVAVPVNASYLGAQRYWPQDPTQHASINVTASSGLPNADFGLIVTARQTSSCGSLGSGTLAYAYTCNRDSATDRPTWGRINFCPGQLSTSNSSWTAQLGVALHEVCFAGSLSGQGADDMNSAVSLASRGLIANG